MGPLDEASVLWVARQVLLALSYLHANSVIHRDIKAANILLTERGEVKLGDFGVASQVINSLRRNSFVGSPYWMAPEVIKRSQYDSKADIWSLGIALYELLRGNPPLANIEPARAIFIIPKNAPPRLDSSFGVAIRDLVNSCLHDDPQRRPTADELLRSKCMRSIKRDDGNPLNRIILQEYREKEIKSKKTTGRGEDEEAQTIDGGVGDTMKSNWTFGTFNSSDDDQVLLGKEINVGHSHDCSIRSLSPPDSHNNDPNGVEGVGSRLQETSISATHDSSITSTGVDFTPSKQSETSSIHRFRGRSLSSLSLLGSLKSNNDLGGVGEGSTQHKKQPSLISIELDLGETYLDQREREKEAQRRERAQMCASTRQVEGLDHIKLLKILTTLKDAQRNFPSLPGPWATSEQIKAKIRESIVYAHEYSLVCQNALDALETDPQPGAQIGI